MKGEFMNFMDGQVGVIDQDNRYLITSPNADFIPQLHFGFDRIKVRADARFGVHDPIQWPQLFHPSHPWMSCILRRPTSPLDRLYCMWRTLTPEDFRVTYPYLEIPWGITKPRLRRELTSLVDTLYEECQQACRSHHDPLLYRHALRMRDGLRRLDYPSTYRDMLRQVVCVQRFYLYTKAIIDWNTIVAPRLSKTGPHHTLSKYMGVFTNNPEHARKLFGIGIPVWVLRRSQQLHPKIVVKHLIDITVPGSIVTEDGEFGHQIDFSSVGLNHLEAITRYGHEYLDIDTHPYANARDGPQSDPASSTIAETSGALSRLQSQSQSPSQSRLIPSSGSKQQASGTSKRPKPYERTNAKQESRKKPPQHQGCDKRVDPMGDWVPSPCPAWAEAVRTLDIEKVPINPNKSRLHVPEPALVFNPEKTFRRNLYVRHWVLFREPLVYSLRNHFTLPAPGNQEWRFYFTYGPNIPSDGTDTRTAKRKARVAEYLRQVFNVQNSDNLSFFGEEVPEDVPVALRKKVAWDLYELGFRQGLLSLDRLHCKGGDDEEVFRVNRIGEIFPDGHAHAVTELPTTNAGLAADDICDRAASLNALRRVLKCWSTAPESVTKMGELSKESGAPFLEAAERTLAQYYCEEYLAQTGRVPVVPRRFPLA